MATVKITSRYYKDKVFVNINLSHRQERKQINLFSIPSKDWDETKEKVKSSHKLSGDYNLKIATEVKKYNDIITGIKLEQKNYTLSDILNYIPDDIFISDAIISYSKGLSYRNERKYLNLKDKIVEYYDTSVNRVDLNYIKGFIKSLENNEKINSKVTIHRYVKFLKTVLRSVGYNNYQVLTFKVDQGHVKKEKLTIEEFICFSKVDERILSRDAFCFCLFSYGTRIGDVLQLREKNIINNKIEFQEQKTGKFKSVIIDDNLQKIIDRYYGESKHKYLLPILEKKWANPKKNKDFQKHIEAKTSMINLDLKIIALKAGIQKKITTHVARHTFTTWASDSDINSRTIQKMMNFSSLRIMENYIESLKSDSDISDAASKTFQGL